MDEYIMFSHNVTIHTMKYLFETNNESGHHLHTQPPVQWVHHPHFQLIFSHSFTYPTTQSHTLSRNQYHIHYPTHPTIQILTPSHSLSFIQQLFHPLSRPLNHWLH